MTETEMLIRLSEQVKHLETLMTNHLHHHFLYTMAMFTAFLSVIGGLALHWLKGRAKPVAKD